MKTIVMRAVALGLAIGMTQASFAQGGGGAAAQEEEVLALAAQVRPVHPAAPGAKLTAERQGEAVSRVRRNRARAPQKDLRAK